MNYSEALELLEYLEEKLVAYRTDTEIEKVFKISEEICTELGLSEAQDADGSERRSQRTTRVSNRLQNFIVEAPIQRDNLENKEEFKRHFSLCFFICIFINLLLLYIHLKRKTLCAFIVFYYRAIFSLIDRLKNEIERRFFTQNKSIILGIKALVPDSETFLKRDDLTTFGELYNLNTGDLKVEVENLTRVMSRKEETSKPKTLLELHHYVEKVSDAFYQLNKLLKIACTMPITTCACERSFSTLRIIKNYLRTSVTENRLQNLMILGVHSCRAKKK